MATSTSDANYFEQVILSMGFKGINDFITKFALPIISVVVVFFFISIVLLTNLPIYVPYIILVLGVSAVFVYPIVNFESKRTEINQHLHLFITFIGTLATLDLDRSILFKKISEKKQMFGVISNISKKILFFSKAWNLGFSYSCRKIAKLSPSQILADFLDRFAIMMDLGQNLTVFIDDEQTAVMDDFAINYQKSLKSIETLQEIFSSLTMALGFMMAIGLLMPLIAGTSIVVVIRIALGAMIFFDLLMLVFVRAFIPEDKLTHDLEYKSKGMTRLINMTYIILPICSFLTLGLFYFTSLSFLLNIAIGMTPLLIIGIVAQDEENDIFKKDRIFPSFIRALGNVVEIRSGAMMSSISSLRVHDFGVMDEHISSVYRRLKTGNDKFITWDYFAAETGSYLISQFIQIFTESVYLGGNAEKIGEIVSTNFTKLISLRRLRLQLASGLRGAMYGSLFGFTVSAYMASELTTMLSKLFTKPFEAMESSGGALSGILTSITPDAALNVNQETVFIYLGVMVIFHSIISALVIKTVDGGTIYSACFDFVALLWLGTLISVFLPVGIKIFLPGMEDVYKF